MSSARRRISVPHALQSPPPEVGSPSGGVATTDFHTICYVRGEARQQPPNAPRNLDVVWLDLAFHAGEELTTGHLLEAAPEIRPLSQTDPERVAAMTEWLDRHAKPASTRGKECCVHKNGSRGKRCVAV